MIVTFIAIAAVFFSCGFVCGAAFKAGKQQQEMDDEQERGELL